jgi:hypothetical protein
MIEKNGEGDVNMQGFKLRISLGKYWKRDINRGKLGIKRNSRKLGYKLQPQLHRNHQY